MASDDTTRSILAGLEDRYELLKELRRGETSSTWLAHERASYRDVLITLVHAGSLPRRELLSQIGADSQLLSVQHHGSVIPVLASHWLADGSLAIVRPRVRGTTLRNMLRATGALSPERTVEILREIAAALDWARRTGMINRGLTAESVCFQQGSGRPLLSFGPAVVLGEDAGQAETVADAPDPSLAPVLSRCSDTATLGRLAWEMLTTRPAPEGGVAGAMSARRGYREPGLADLRPDLPLSVAAEIEGALRCEREASPRGPTAFLAALAAAAGLGATAPMPIAERPRIVPPLIAPGPARDRLATTPPERSVAASPPARPIPPSMSAPVQRTRRRSGVGLIALTVVAVIVLAAAALMMQRDDEPRVARAPRVETTPTVSTGDIDFDRTAIDTGVLVVPGGGRRSTVALPEVEPSVQPNVVPGPGAAAPGPTVFAREGTPAPAMPTRSADPCGSPTDSDQQACLRGRIANNDAELNRVYQDLTRQMRDEPEAVASLRAQQREWLQQRDAACRQRVDRSGTWAPGFAQCLGEMSAERARALREELQRRQGGI